MQRAVLSGPERHIHRTFESTTITPQCDQSVSHHRRQHAPTRLLLLLLLVAPCQAAPLQR